MADYAVWGMQLAFSLTWWIVNDPVLFHLLVACCNCRNCICQVQEKRRCWQVFRSWRWECGQSEYIMTETAGWKFAVCGEPLGTLQCRLTYTFFGLPWKYILLDIFQLQSCTKLVLLWINYFTSKVVVFRLIVSISIVRQTEFLGYKNSLQV